MQILKRGVIVAQSWRRLLIVLAIGVGAAGCDGPTAPAELPPVGAPVTHTQVIDGVVTATNGGEPIAAATVEFGGAVATTDPNGHFSITSAADPASTGASFVVRGSGLITRSLFASPSGSLNVDAIRDGGGFDLRFYRQLVRNGLETSGDLFPLVRWTAQPRVFLRSVDEHGARVDPEILNFGASLIKSAIGAWTGGRLAASVQIGEPAGGTNDVVLVRWLDGSEPGVCGKAPVGGTEIYLNYVSPSCACSGLRLSPAAVRHEVGHVLGFWHTDSPDDVMYGQANAEECARDLSLRERLHGAIAYQRPVGNTDLDNDPPAPTRPVIRAMIP